MRYVSLFSGIEAASVAWEPLGWEPVAFSEIEPFPCELLAQRFPNVPNLGDITKVDWRPYCGAVDLIVGGSPCQSFSIAGNREGLAGESGLMFEYIRAVREVLPEYFVWENVPGALSSEKGGAFGQLLREMDECGYGLAWRVLDAQFFGVAQRRRRLFLVGVLGDVERAAEILFERESLRWDHPSSRSKRKELARTSNVGANACGEGNCLTPWDVQSKRIYDVDGTSPALPSGTSEGMNIQPIVTYPAVCMADDNAHAAINDDLCGSLKVGGSPSIIGFPWNAGGKAAGTSIDDGTSPTIRATRSGEPAIAMQESERRFIVRRLMPIECERLQGFPDGYTDIEFRGKLASDTARYKALGNSMAVPVMRWIGERIENVCKR